MSNNIEQTRSSMGAVIDRSHAAVVDLTDRAEKSVDAAAEHAAERVVEGAHVAAELVRDGAATASASAHRGVDGAVRAVNCGLTRAESDLSRAAAATTDFIAKNPAKSLLIAGSLGLAIGLAVPWRRLFDSGAGSPT